jgi:hypothetical protein
MNLLSLLKSLNTQAEALEAQARAIRQDIGRVKQVLFGGDIPEMNSRSETNAQAVEEPPTVKPVVQSAMVPAMPSLDEIRAKAAQYGVCVDDIFVGGTKPSNQQKNQAMARIIQAKRALEGAAVVNEADPCLENSSDHP